MKKLLLMLSILSTSMYAGLYYDPVSEKYYILFFSNDPFYQKDLDKSSFERQIVHDKLYRNCRMIISYVRSKFNNFSYEEQNKIIYAKIKDYLDSYPDIPAIEDFYNNFRCSRQDLVESIEASAPEHKIHPGNKKYWDQVWSDLELIK